MPTPRDPVSHYRRLLVRRTDGTAVEAAEAAELNASPDLSEHGIRVRTTALADNLHQIVAKQHGDDPKLHALSDRIARSGVKALRVLGSGDAARLAAELPTRQLLEVIVRTDGSRPSFTVKNGKVDLTSSPAGAWRSAIVNSGARLQDAIACVGRIDDPSSPQGFQGTGALVDEDLIVTNRHVLQAIATRKSPNEWEFNKDVQIDFGHEFRGRKSVKARSLKKVVFVGPRAIDPYSIAHSKLDLALIQLERAKPATRPNVVFSVDLAPDWDDVDQRIYIIGYPGRPDVASYTPTLLEKLFRSTFGCKRVAPGEVIKSSEKIGKLTAAHDATTLGGNSGSVVVVIGREFQAAGIHYGGKFAEPRENWCHVYGRIENRKGEGGTITLAQAFRKAGVTVHT